MAKRAELALRLCFAALLLTSAIGKLLDNRGFAEVISQYQLWIPAALLLPVGLALSLFELGLGLGLLARYRLRLLAAATAALHLVYLLLAALTLLRGIELQNCGCFGVFLARPLRVQTLAEDAVLLGLALALCALLQRGTRCQPRAALRAVPAQEPSAHSKRS